MTPLLTEAERPTQAEIDWALQYLENWDKRSSGYIIAKAYRALLSARAVSMETVGWMRPKGEGDAELITAYQKDCFKGYRIRGNLPVDECTEPLVLRSAAEAYTAGMREREARLVEALRPFANQVVSENGMCHAGLVSAAECGRCGPILRARTLTDTTTKEGGGEDADRN